MTTPTAISNKPGRWKGGGNLSSSSPAESGGGAAAAAAGGLSSSVAPSLTNGRVPKQNTTIHHSRTGSSSSSSSISSVCCNLESMKQTILQKLMNTAAEKEEDLVGFCEWAMTYVGKTFTSHRLNSKMASSSTSSAVSASSVGGGNRGGGPRGVDVMIDDEGGLHHSSTNNTVNRGVVRERSPSSNSEEGDEEEEGGQGSGGETSMPLHRAKGGLTAAEGGGVVVGENGRRVRPRIMPSKVESPTRHAASAGLSTAARSEGAGICKSGAPPLPTRTMSSSSSSSSSFNSDGHTDKDGSGEGKGAASAAVADGKKQPPVSNSELETVSILLEFSSKAKEQVEGQKPKEAMSPSVSSTTTTNSSTMATLSAPAWAPQSVSPPNGQRKCVPPFPLPSPSQVANADRLLNCFAPPAPAGGPCISPRSLAAAAKELSDKEASIMVTANGPSSSAPTSSLESKEMQFNLRPGVLNKTSIANFSSPSLAQHAYAHPGLSSSLPMPCPTSVPTSAAMAMHPMSTLNKNQSPHRPSTVSSAITNDASLQLPPPPSSSYPAQQQQKQQSIEVPPRTVAPQYIYYMQAGSSSPEGIQAGRWTYFHGIGETTTQNNIFMGQFLGQLQEAPCRVVAGIVRYNQDSRHNAVLIYDMPQDIFFLAAVQHVERLVSFDFLPEDALCRLRDKVLRDWIPARDRETETPNSVLPPHAYLPVSRLVDGRSMYYPPQPSPQQAQLQQQQRRQQHHQSVPPPTPPSDGGAGSVVMAGGGAATRNVTSGANLRGGQDQSQQRPQLMVDSASLLHPPFHSNHVQPPSHLYQQQQFPRAPLPPPAARLAPPTLPRTSSSCSQQSSQRMEKQHHYSSSKSSSQSTTQGAQQV